MFVGVITPTTELIVAYNLKLLNMLEHPVSPYRLVYHVYYWVPLYLFEVKLKESSHQM